VDTDSGEHSNAAGRGTSDPDFRAGWALTAADRSRWVTDGAASEGSVVPDSTVVVGDTVVAGDTVDVGMEMAGGSRGHTSVDNRGTSSLGLMVASGLMEGLCVMAVLGAVAVAPGVVLAAGLMAGLGARAAMVVPGLGVVVLVVVVGCGPSSGRPVHTGHSPS